MESELEGCTPDIAPVIFIGQDRSGHWLVQDGARRLEGRFISRAAAARFAAEEAELYHAQLRIAPEPLSPLIAFPKAA